MISHSMTSFIGIGSLPSQSDIVISSDDNLDSQGNIHHSSHQLLWVIELITLYIYILITL